jgi:hypothetical protein
MTDVPELGARTAVYAVMASKLKKVGKGVGSSGREIVMFGVHKGEGEESVKAHLEGLGKTALGVFITKRCKEIRKHPIVYVAALSDDTDIGELSNILSILYGATPFAPKHHAMPQPYTGPAVTIINSGKVPGIAAELQAGEGLAEPRRKDADSTSDPEADEAMSKAIANEAAATRRMTQAEMDARGIATEKVDKPHHLATEKVDKPPKLVETTKMDKDDVRLGIETERVPKPPEIAGAAESDTEFVPKPKGDEAEAENKPKPESNDDDSAILDEARRGAS